MKAIVITGTPGTGKTELSKRLKRTYPKSIIIDANRLIIKNKLYSGSDRYGAKIANLKGLQKLVNGIIARNRKNNLLILEGHLLCDIKVKGAIAIVLREHLKTLLKRMMRRGYARGKIRDNIVSEAIDYCGEAASKNYEKTYEAMLSDRDSTAYIERLIEKGYAEIKRINMMEELLDERLCMEIKLFH